MDAQQIITLLNLQPHPEGGYFRETYRAAETVADSGRSTPRNLSTCIYYLLTADTFSCLHKVSSDELFHFYLGDPIEMLQLLPDGSSRIVKIGSNLTAGEAPQLVIEKGTWQGSRLLAPGRLALIGATVAPGFDYQDYTEGSRAELIAQYPDRKDLIVELTRKL